MLAKIWNFLIGRFCKHQWLVVDKYRCSYHTILSPYEQTDMVFVLQCKHCGEMKSKNVP